MKNMAVVFWQDFENLTNELQRLSSENPELWKSAELCLWFDLFYKKYKCFNSDNLEGYLSGLKEITENLETVVAIAYYVSNKEKALT
ncbi:hypothetical protein [Serratia sp. UGAL515B_01]|uniref:hypothetical protein n=1 Tax=Serratia sp. UGAL515B_01 TaxID=2986763 RepID=UPI0029555D13|nr:hypothetical protein [Serratia sp. UGAL515B_01]WON77803.1 hypothetical protein OK023_03705 [Serratia sp. UGAL515B_01]